MAIKIKKTYTSRKLVAAVVSSGAIVLILSYSAAAYINNWWPVSLFSSSEITSEDTSTQELTEEEIKANAEKEAQDKQDFLDNQGNTPENLIPQPTANDIELNISGTTSSLTIQTKLKGITSGTCLIKLVNAGISISREAEVMFTPEYSTCAGFSIPKSDLSSGLWLITLEVITSDGKLVKTTSYKM